MSFPSEASYNTEKSEGVEGESAQRCKARLERYQRTAERAVCLFFLRWEFPVYLSQKWQQFSFLTFLLFQAKALAEKNKRDLLAQREQAERNVNKNIWQNFQNC